MNHGVIIEKIPSLICKKCGSFRVMMTDDGPECSDCEPINYDNEIKLSLDVEYLIYQLNQGESY